MAVKNVPVKSLSAFKREILRAVIHKLQEERQTLIAAARAAHEAAIHSESVAEDQYDTRGIEASYLAGAQAQRVTEVERRIQVFQTMLDAVDSLDRTRIEVGAVAELSADGRKSTYFFVGDGGGISVQVAGRTVNLIHCQAPLGEALAGKATGDEIEIEVQGRSRDYEILEVG